MTSSGENESGGEYFTVSIRELDALCAAFLASYLRAVGLALAGFLAGTLSRIVVCSFSTAARIFDAPCSFSEAEASPPL